MVTCVEKQVFFNGPNRLILTVALCLLLGIDVNIVKYDSLDTSSLLFNNRSVFSASNPLKGDEKNSVKVVKVIPKKS